MKGEPIRVIALRLKEDQHPLLLIHRHRPRPTTFSLHSTRELIPIKLKTRLETGRWGRTGETDALRTSEPDEPDCSSHDSQSSGTGTRLKLSPGPHRRLRHNECKVKEDKEKANGVSTSSAYL